MAEASAPASSANLGPAFDSIALALELRCAVEARPANSWGITHVGTERLGGGERDLVMEAASAAAGPSGPLELSVSNEIPLATGLGSSAAALAAGAAAAWRAVDREFSRSELFELVTTLEGHPDNAAAAIHGGLVAVTVAGEVLPLELSESLRVVLAVPDERLPTVEARRVLPDTVDRDATVRAMRRIVALIEGLRLGQGRLLAAAAGDELHEAPRAHLSPTSVQLIEAARDAGAAHACWSGAGPSIIALCTEPEIAAVVGALEDTLGESGRVLEPEVAYTGVV